MPQTKTPRKPRTTSNVSYNPIFPGGRAQDRGSNQRARVERGDRAVNESVAWDYNRTFGTPKSKLKVVSDGSGGTKIITHKD